MNNRLLPVGSSTLEIAATKTATEITRVPVPLRTLWDSRQCPVELLPYLAWALSVDRWDDEWSESEKRRVVDDAFYIHQHKGTLAAIRRVINNMGYGMALDEWWQVADPAGTFRLSIDVGETGMSQRIFNELERIVKDARPVSRHISRLTISVSSKGDMNLAIAVTDSDTITVYPRDYTPVINAGYDGSARHDGSLTYTFY